MDSIKIKIDKPFPTVEENPNIEQYSHILKLRCRLCGEIVEKGMRRNTVNKILNGISTIIFTNIKCPNKVDDKEIILYDILSLRPNPDYDPNYKEE